MRLFATFRNGPSGKFRRISIDDVFVGDLVYIVCPAFSNLRAMCAKILEKTPDEVTYTYQNRKRDRVTMPFAMFINGEIKLYMELDYWKPREALLKLVEGTPNADGVIPGYLYDDLVKRDISSYIDADGFKRPSGGKKHNKKSRKSRKSRKTRKTRKSRKSRKSKTFKNIN